MSALLRLRNGWRWLHDPFAVLRAGLARHGPTFELELPVHGRCLVTGDPQLLRALVSSPDLDAGRGITALRKVLGHGSLIMLDGPSHHARRRLVAPAFRADVAARYDALTVDTAREATRALRVDRATRMYDVLLSISRTAIVRALFAPESNGRTLALEHAVDAFLRAATNPVVLFARPLQVDLGGFSGWGRLLRARAALSELVRAEIVRARCSPTRGALIEPLTPGLDDEALVEEVLALLVFGHDTGAAAMSWALAHLVEHPEALRRAADDPAPGGYLEACIDESMRLCPVVCHLTRVAARPTRLGAHSLEVGQRVLPATWIAHHDPASWTEPEAFRPERFLAPAQPDDPRETSYLPFGLAPRTCVGRPFVLRQMRLVLHTLITTVRLSPRPGWHPRPVRQNVLIVPEGGTPMVVLGPSRP